MSAPLPGMPELPPQSPTPPKPGVHATRIGSGRLCERCCRDIHVYGPEVAAYPQPARWRVVEDEVAERLCERHKTERCNK